MKSVLMFVNLVVLLTLVACATNQDYAVRCTLEDGKIGSQKVMVKYITLNYSQTTDPEEVCLGRFGSTEYVLKSELLGPNGQVLAVSTPVNIPQTPTPTSVETRTPNTR